MGSPLSSVSRRPGAGAGAGPGGSEEQDTTPTSAGPRSRSPAAAKTAVKRPWHVLFGTTACDLPGVLPVPSSSDAHQLGPAGKKPRTHKRVSFAALLERGQQAGY
jgi:hypothetical protein